MAFPFYRPKSILRLVLAGFALVGVPLMIALVNAALSVDRLANQTQQAVFQAVEVTQNSRALVEAITAMERNARQYQVLGTRDLFDVYAENHQVFGSTTALLREQPLSGSQFRLLKEIEDAERDIHQNMAALPHDAEELGPVINRFGALAGLAQRFLSQNSRVIGQEVRRMQETAQETQRSLVVQAAALVPAALVLTGLFAIVIARPIRQLDQAIRRLGNEDLEQHTVVSGPRDLEQLGERLDWLRLRLRELEEEKTKFLRHVSHELKTPLTAIREGAGLLGEEVMGTLNPQQREIAEILQENVVQLQRLIEDLLNFSMASNRSARLVRRPVELRPLIESVLADHKVAMLARHLKVHQDLQSVSYVADEERLRTVVDNLLSNATKYTPDGGTVSVLLFDDQGQACIEVADTGPGIEAADRERVFEAFYQGPHSTDSHISGTGLGLSIAKEYVQAHGGRIEVVADGEPGARIRVTLAEQVEGAGGV